MLIKPQLTVQYEQTVLFYIVLAGCLNWGKYSGNLHVVVHSGLLL